MKTISFLSHKGGTGKSTLAIHLAVAAQAEGLEVLLVDLDHHSASVAEWASVRDDKQPLAVTAQFSDVAALHQQATDEGFDLLILDCPPYINAETLQASKIADITLLPVAPRFTEISTLPRDLELVSPPYFVLLNSCTTGAEEVREMLEEIDIPVSPLCFTRLDTFTDTFTDALNYGQGVTEYEKDGVAAGQIKAFLGWMQSA
jgi:chromosome partitioning protein